MHTIIGSSGRDCVLIILFHLYETKAKLVKVICSGWVNMNPPRNCHIERRANPILIYNSLATYLNNSKSKKLLVLSYRLWRH